ncbi:MAG: hypothetical protein ABI402_17440 [Ferruginibacter sp.]
MKQITKNIFYCLLFFLFISCKKENKFVPNAQIVGEDFKTCVCCGGVEITIDNNTNPNGNPYFLVNTFPQNFSLGDNPQFPIAVHIDWSVDSLGCFGNYVNISAISKE